MSMLNSRIAWFVLGMMFAVIAAGGGAYAATGGTFVLGRANTAGATTSLRNANGTALALTAKAGAPALAVNTSAKVTNLNSDRLDGLHHSAFQRRVSESCPTGKAIRAIGSAGGLTCVDVGSDSLALADVQQLHGLSCESPSGVVGTTNVSVGDLQPGGNGFYRFPISIVCQKPWPADGTACNDGDDQTTDDIYTNGQCAGTPPDCDDGNPYTIDGYTDGVCFHIPMDDDGDGSPQPEDCDDANPAVHPGATEITNNGIDDDCDTLIDESDGG